MTRSKRSDIQGLRAFAAGVVVIDHLFGHPEGGFAGVDVFFVISGYLITDLLMSDMSSGPTLGGYLWRFYKRRIRRLMPAALAVIGTTLVVSYFVFVPWRFGTVRSDAWWAAIFLANWHFIATGTDYFAAGGPVSPFQHYWSLAVEEQFYLVWPLALFTSVRLVTKISRRSCDHDQRPYDHQLRGCLLVALALIASSLSLAFLETSSSPVSAYFSTFTRGWELGIGALCAGMTKKVKAPGPRAASVMSLVGLAAIVWSVFAVSDGGSFPAPEALWPCLGTAVVLMADPLGGRAFNPLLTNRASVRIGDMSYSLYLVHFPVIVLLGSLMPKGAYFYATALLITGGLTGLLHHGVEMPVLRSRLLASRRRVNLKVPTPTRRATAASLAGAAAITLAGVLVLALWPGEGEALGSKSEIVSAALGREGPPRSAGDATSKAVSSLQASIRSALRAQNWPNLDPSIDTELAREGAPADLDACASVQLPPSKWCTFGDPAAPHTLYVVGDSTAVGYAEAYREIVDHSPGWKLRIAAGLGCSFDDIVIANVDPWIVENCARHNSEVLEDIARTRPTLVVITDTYAPRQPASGGPALDDTKWIAALSAEANRIVGASEVMIVEPPPLGGDPADCYSRFSPPIACVYSVPADNLARAAAEQRFADREGWAFVNTEELFCDVSSGLCPEFAEGTPIKHDDVHISYAYDDRIWPVLSDLINTAGESHWRHWSAI